MSENNSPSKNIEKTIPSDVDDNEFSLSDMYDPRSKYAPEQKLAAAMAYVRTGNSKQAAKFCEVPHPTIRWWKASAHWWPDAVAHCRKQKNDELDAMLTDVQEMAVGQLVDLVKNGEEVTTKTGDVVRKTISARDLSVIFGTLFDKRNLIRGEPTSVSGRKDQSEILEDLKTKFEKLSEDIQQSNNRKIISDQ